MKFLISFFSLLVSTTVFACKGETTYVDISKAEKDIEVTADHISIRHTSTLQFKTEADIEIKEAKNSSIGGMFIYNLIRPFKRTTKPPEGKIIVFDGKKSIELNFKMLPQKKGGCSKGQVDYN